MTSPASTIGRHRRSPKNHRGEEPILVRTEGGGLEETSRAKHAPSEFDGICPRCGPEAYAVIQAKHRR